MTMMTGISVDTFVMYGGVTGTAPSSLILKALQMGWSQVEREIGTPLFPSLIVDERHPWPHNDRVILEKNRVQSIFSVIAAHDEETCRCDWTDYTGCANLVDPTMGVVDVQECYNSAAPCTSCGCASGRRGWGTMLVISYTAGMSQPLPDEIVLAIVLIAKDWLAIMTGGNSEFDGVSHSIKSWSSMDYSESYGDVEFASRWGATSRAEAVRKLLRDFKIKRVVDAFGTRPRPSSPYRRGVW